VEDLRSYYHKPYYKVPGAQLPFSDNLFDGVFTYTTHEHIPDLEIALEEIVRVLKPGGVCLFAPAWHTRSWFSKGYKVRPYSELALGEKFIKLTIPFRDFILIRWPFVICRRIMRLFEYILNDRSANPLRYKKLKPNYEVYWHSDSDACNSIDPFDVILWFKSRGFICCGYEKLLTALFVRTYALELQKPIT
jgi:SAM-dependent methyltransferase